MNRAPALALACMLAGCAAAQQPVASPVSATAASEGTPAFASADALLEALERSTDDLRDVRADVVYDRLDAVTEDRERRMGRLVLAQSPDGTRRFGIIFDRCIDSAGHASPQVQRFAFGEGWLVEFDDARKQCIARQLAPEGSRLDPLKLGEGPLPLPVGQRAEEVRRRFTVSLAPAPEAPLLKSLAGVQGVVLVPKRGSGVDEDFEEVRVWYDTRTFVPVGVVARLKGGDVKTVLLRNVARNGGLDAASSAMLERRVPEGWQQDRRPWRKAQP
ncbi:MAG: hypothetical protein FJ292_00235 [Planctomycetes bacterium]|nr:hypothetical protein [Planctomycetota bacterium]